MNSNKHSLRGCFITAGVVGLLILLVPIVGVVIWTRASKARLQEQLAAKRDRGEPTSAEELDAFYVAAPGQDTTDLLLAALEPLARPEFSRDAFGLPIVGNSDLVIPPPGQAWAEQAAVEQLLEKYDPTMRKLHEAADLGAAARFDLQFQDGLAMELRHTQDLRAAAQMLSLEAHLRAHLGNVDGAADSIVALFTLSRSLETEPVLVSFLVRLALSSMALRLTNELLPHVPFSDQDLRRLQDTFRAADFRDQLRSALLGEQVFAVQVYQNPESLPELSGKHVPGLSRSDDLLLYLELMEPLSSGVEQDWLAQRDAAKQSHQLLQDRLNTPLQGLRYMYTAMLFPANEPIVDAGARNTAYRDATDALLAAELFRRQHGKPPATLQDLIPEFLPQVPLDPFDGKPLRCFVNDTHVVIYSIGRDEVDNKGTGDSSMEPDIVARLPLEVPATP